MGDHQQVPAPARQHQPTGSFCRGGLQYLTALITACSIICELHHILVIHSSQERPPFPKPLLLLPNTCQLQEGAKSHARLVPGGSSPQHDATTSAMPRHRAVPPIPRRWPARHTARRQLPPWQQQCPCQHPGQIHQDFGHLLLHPLRAESLRGPKKLGVLPRGFGHQDQPFLWQGLGGGQENFGRDKSICPCSRTCHLENKTPVISYCFLFQFTRVLCCLWVHHVSFRNLTQFIGKNLGLLFCLLFPSIMKM